MMRMPARPSVHNAALDEADRTLFAVNEHRAARRFGLGDDAAEADDPARGGTQADGLRLVRAIKAPPCDGRNAAV